MTGKKMIWTKGLRFLFILVALIGCSGGGGSDSTTTPTPTTPTAATISVLPANFDFGIVTDVNSVDPLEVTVQNDGMQALTVSDIALSDAVNFSLDVNGGTNPCGSLPQSLAEGDACTVMVDFIPQDTILPPEGIDYTAVLTIQSNDLTTPAYEMSLAGKRQNITAINVVISQIDACPRVVGTPVTAYVSVTDQGGFPVTSLEAPDFSLTEAGVAQLPAADFVNNSVTISVAMVMDYSFSITQQPDNVTDMENAALGFIDQLGSDDEAEIIKYATTIEVTQSFTADQALLAAAIQSTPSTGGETALYDAIDQAITDILARNKDRRAIIIITDGEDNDGSGNPLSDATLEEIIASAQAGGVPVFTVGLGDRVDPDLLQSIADETGGKFYPSVTSDNLPTIFQKIASLLFTDQYILTYNTGLDGTQTGNLEVTATYAPGITGTDTKTIPACD